MLVKSSTIINQEELFTVEYKNLLENSLNQIHGFKNNSIELKNKYIFTQNLFISLLCIEFSSKNSLEDLWGSYKINQNNSFYKDCVSSLFMSDAIWSNFFKLNHDNIDIDDFVFYKFIDFLNKYDYSIDENESQHKVTPHVLEKIFEESLSERSETGSFYTPQNVVSFMMKETLKRFLSINSEENYRNIELFIDNNVVQFDDTDQIIELLDNVTIIDPSCGSGAFLVGIFYELMHYKKLINSRDEYQLKLDTIHNNIYGTDINYGAINVAKTRLLLAVSNDFDIAILFNILCGDSLCGDNPNPILQKSLFDESVHMDNTDFISWKKDFPKVFNNGGFDIVIGNPPYVSSSEIGSNKNSIVKQYDKIVPANSDLYVYFYIRGLEILKKNGIQSFICSNSWLYTEYGVDLTKYILNNAFLETIYESLVEKQFTSAEINTIISFIQKTKTNNDTALISLESDFETSINNKTHRTEKIVKRKDLLDNNKFGIYISSSSIITYVEKNYRNKLIELNRVCDLRTGITDYSNVIGKDETYEYKDKGSHPLVKNIRGMNNINIDLESIESYMIEPTNLTKTMFDNFTESNDLLKSRMAVNCFISTTARTLLSPIPVYFGNVFNVFYDINVDIIKLCAIMNSSYFQLLANIHGQKSMGGGLLQLKINDLKKINIVNPDLLPEINVSMFDSDDWDVRNMSIERIKLDNIVFDALELSINERENIYNDLCELVNNRVKKSQT